MYPGTSTRLITGILKASQNLINREALSQALMSNTPAIDFGWLAIIPTDHPFSLEKQVIILVANWGNN
jgi:hypothetical protein